MEAGGCRQSVEDVGLWDGNDLVSVAAAAPSSLRAASSPTFVLSSHSRTHSSSSSSMRCILPVIVALVTAATRISLLSASAWSVKRPSLPPSIAASSS